MLKRILRVAPEITALKSLRQQSEFGSQANAYRNPRMIFIRTTLAAASLAIATAMMASAEIVASTCRLLSYGGTKTTVEVFRCDFLQHGGNVMVISPVHEFNFLAAEQGETYIRINSIPLRFTRTGEYTLEVTQSPWLR